MTNGAPAEFEAAREKARELMMTALDLLRPKGWALPGPTFRQTDLAADARSHIARARAVLDQAARR